MERMRVFWRLLDAEMARASDDEKFAFLVRNALPDERQRRRFQALARRISCRAALLALLEKRALPATNHSVVRSLVGAGRVEVTPQVDRLVRSLAEAPGAPPARWAGLVAA